MSSWKKFIDNEDNKIYYKQEEGLSPITCYLEGIINASVLNVGLIMGDVEGYKDWLPITPISDILKSVTHFRKLMYIRNALQWPMWHREIFVEGGAFVIKGEQALGLSMQTVPD